MERGSIILEIDMPLALLVLLGDGSLFNCYDSLKIYYLFDILAPQCYALSDNEIKCFMITDTVNTLTLLKS